MTKQLQISAYDRRAVMRKAHREYAASCRRGDGLTFGYWLAYAWRVARDRRQRDMTANTMRMIADMIEDHASRRIVLAPEIRVSASLLATVARQCCDCRATVA